MSSSSDTTTIPESNSNVTCLTSTARRIRGPPPAERPAYLPPPQIRSHTTNDWDISCCVAPISNSQMLAAFEERTKIKPPEMTYLENYVRFTHLPSGKEIYFDAERALVQCLKPEFASNEVAPQESPSVLPDVSLDVKKQSPEAKGVVESESKDKQNDTTEQSPSTPLSSPKAPIAKPVQVKFAAAWKDLIDRTGMKQLDSIHDWTYTTTYNGHVRHYNKAPQPYDVKPTPEDSLVGVDKETQKLGVESKTLCEANSGEGNNTSSSSQIADSSSEDTVHSKNAAEVQTKGNLTWIRTESKIDYELLTRRDPILFFEEIDLFEDELHDNGVSKLYVKFRVMPTCFFILLRLWVRVDYVVIRLRDYRFFHKFGTNDILRETRIYEATMEDLKTLDLPFATSACWRNPDEASQNLPVKDHFTESIQL